MATEQQARPAQRSVNIRTVLLVLFVVILTIFAVQNWVPVRVWPLGQTSVTVVITISFILGGLIGWLAHSLATGRPARRE
jgi:uncharacterized integral membrane protein